MAVYEKVMTQAEFAEYVRRTENEDQLYKLIHGYAIEVFLRAPYYSAVGNRLSGEVYRFCRDHHIQAYLSGSDGAYQLGDDVVAPDFAFKRAKMSDEIWDPIPPEWAVEIIAPTDRAFAVRGNATSTAMPGYCCGKSTPNYTLLTSTRRGRW